MKALDLFCGGGGAAAGLVAAGYEVTGVDLFPQTKYPYQFIRGDALNFPLDGFDLIWASPVCKRFSSATRTAGTSAKWPDQIAPIRERLRQLETPWIIENVDGAPLRDAIMLCGTMFGLPLYRHRFFESNRRLVAPPHPAHTARVTKMGRPVKTGEFINPVGHFSGVKAAQVAMKISWLGQKGLAQAVPPAYAKYLAKQI